LRDRPLRSYSRISQHSVETEGSVPCSEENSTGPHHEPDQTSQYHPYPIPLRSILISSTHLRPSIPSGLFRSGSPTSNIYASSFPPVVPHALPISSSFHLIILIIYLGKSTSYETPRYAVFSTLLSLHPSSVQICFVNSNRYVLDSGREDKRFWTEL
jgi:hypothetical protein